MRRRQGHRLYILCSFGFSSFSRYHFWFSNVPFILSRQFENWKLETFDWKNWKLNWKFGKAALEEWMYRAYSTCNILYYQLHLYPHPTSFTTQFMVKCLLIKHSMDLFYINDLFIIILLITQTPPWKTSTECS